MSATAAALLQVALLVATLAVVHVPLGDYMARVFTSTRHTRAERAVYAVGRIDADSDQRWPVYARSVLGFSLASVLLLYAFLRLQDHLPLSLGFSRVDPDGAWNTAVSFVTNTNWQWYSGESAMGHLVQMAGLTVQNFTSAAVGLAVAIALIRGFTRANTDRLGNFWVDMIRATFRILLPLAFVAAVVLLLGGVVQSFAGAHDVTTLSGGTQTIVGGPIASQEAIKDLGTNGGGFFNANSAHPFESPTAWTNLLEIFLLLVIPFSLPRTFGRLVGDKRQGLAILGVMGTLWGAAVAVASWAEMRGLGSVPQLAGAAMEGKEVRFGPAASALFAASTTSTSTGSVNSFHDSFTGLGGGVTLLNMMLGEVSPGGVGTGLYGILVVAVLTVFLAGLMVGRTPEYLGKKIGRREVTLVSLSILTMPALVLIGAAITAAVPSLAEASIQEAGAHGLSETLYAYASAANNNGSAFGGFAAGTPYQNTALGLAMMFGRFVPIVLALALAGSLARQHPVPASAGTLPTHTPIFVVLLGVVVVIVAGLTFFPALALAPIAEALL
ncbi:potassium-transporting ATPase subunit KdpA [Cellulomonas sp. KRMCY2]|uniref:potassium-transporting ATPase subunit KdpA n=1 Tax=Cellulomonas sp. KRMCY2 TaxID=1304865 RepID=UPI00045EA01C|nr:potassium-transporting ATPase subunit KdpA [Cellulomonas sp. KRMCY2]